MELKVIDYETAKLAKEAGFDWETLERYDLNIGHYEDSDAYANYNSWYNHASAPTQELLRQFLRTKHGVHISVEPMITGRKEQITFKEWTTDILRKGENLPDVDLGHYSSYEQALEAGLKEALKYLSNQKSEL